MVVAEIKVLNLVITGFDPIFNIKRPIKPILGCYDLMLDSRFLTKCSGCLIVIKLEYS